MEQVLDINGPFVRKEEIDNFLFPLTTYGTEEKEIPALVIIHFQSIPRIVDSGSRVVGVRLDFSKISRYEWSST